MDQTSNIDAFLQDEDTGLLGLNCTVNGMSCGGCAIKVEAHLSKINGVVRAHVNASTKRLKFVWDPEINTAETILASLSEAGYPATPFVEGPDQPAETSLLIPMAISGFATMNVMAISFAVWAGLVTDMGDNTRQYMNLLSAAIVTPAVIYAGSVFFLPAFKALRARRMAMDVPIALAIITTMLASYYELSHQSEHVYFDAAISLIFFLLIGRVLEQGMHKRSTSASDNLRLMLQGKAVRLNPDGTRENILADDLRARDRVLVCPGETVPADGILRSGHAFIDESIISGESIPKDVIEGYQLVAGSKVVNIAIEMIVTSVGAGSRLAEIAVLTEQAEAHRGRTQLLADKFAQAYGPVVIGGAIFGFFIWFFALDAGLSESLLISVAVLVVTCPCAAGLATPAVVVRAVNLLMGSGVILRSAGALERLAEIQHVIFDKTGTLTTAELSLQHDLSKNIIERASAMAANSTHPLPQALVKLYPLPAEKGCSEITGQGLLATDGARLGSADFVEVKQEQGLTGPSLWFKPPNADATCLYFQDTLRDDASVLVDGFTDQGYPITLLSGDTKVSVALTAKELGISDWHANQSPEDKISAIREIESRGRHTLMIGDGLNDTPSLAAAHSSMALSSAASATQSAADIILVGDRLLPALEALAIAKKARKLIKQNLTFSLVYNVIALPIALFGGLTPMIAAILMSSSSLIVMLNALRLGK